MLLMMPTMKSPGTSRNGGTSRLKTHTSRRCSEPFPRQETSTLSISWLRTQWPTSPVSLKKYAAILSPSRGKPRKPECRVDNQFDSSLEDLIDEPVEEIEVAESVIYGPEMVSENQFHQSHGTIELSDTRSSLARLMISQPKITTTDGSEGSVKESISEASVKEELEEFKNNLDEQVKLFPDYLSSDEKLLIKTIAEKSQLGCQFGGRKIAVFKLLNSSPYVTSSCHRALVTRNKALSIEEDPYVDVPALAQHGKEGFIARLRLRRMNSGGGSRRNMLWDVAQLSNADGIADPVHEGEGGVYAVQSRSSGQKLAMFKPTEEEKFVREGISPGEGAVREEAAYVLDSRTNGFSGVPATAVARVYLSNIGHAKHGAVQRFMGSIGSMENYGMPFDLSKAIEFVPVEQVHRIGLLDIRLFNTDRHPGNILLIGEKPPYTMVPIDHGCILPSWYHLSEARFDWLEYPQCKAPFSEVSLKYIEMLDAEADAIVLRKLGIREECVTTLKICTLFLQLAAKANQTLYWMATYMQRSGCFENPSRLELAIMKACNTIGISFSFVENEFKEKKSEIRLGILSRRPPSAFFHALRAIFEEDFKFDD